MNRRDDDTLREGLAGYGKDELIDLVLHLVRAYVVEGTQPFKPEAAMVNIPRTLRELDFPGLVTELKRQLGLPELELLAVRDNQVYVKLGGRDFVVSPNALVDVLPSREERSQARPERAQAEPAERPARDDPPARDERPAEPPRKEAPQRAPADTGAKADRFKMLDLD
jgi:hypothetical protein